MKGMFKIVNDPAECTIRLRMSGEYDRTGMAQLATELRSVCDEYAGGRHLILADMRGMAPLDPEVASIFGDLIAYTREHGVACCVHLSDDSIQRLQAARLGRQISLTDDRTVDVVSIQEAERVLADARTKLFSDAGSHPSC